MILLLSIPKRCYELEKFTIVQKVAEIKFSDYFLDSYVTILVCGLEMIFWNWNVDPNRKWPVHVVVKFITSSVLVLANKEDDRGYVSVTVLE